MAVFNEGKSQDVLVLLVLLVAVDGAVSDGSDSVGVVVTMI